ncbi:FtsX-like permease family protein [Pseudoroseicyclus tamaricis]|uniref:FtsX-like permease family protein n=1 Tax=Pseudoroseicyclus tamaricis TaxID=2705421 RepID=A0A6B2JF18_9RHOB|nr:FtsX-like permease family protein [Pseudoroseicyclus tamaricis]NDU99552.1 FtsX-like permease family protein [Pseudoroseicyclus tamaricis]
MTRATLAAFLSHWRRAPLQFLALLAGLSLATALWTAVQAINAEARAAYDSAAGILGEADHDQLVAIDDGPIPIATFTALRRSGWLVSPVAEGQWQGQRLVGIDPLSAPFAPGEGTGFDLATFLAPPGQITGTAAALAAVPAELEAERIPDPTAAPGTLITDLAVAQRLLGLEGQASRLILMPGVPLGRPPLSDVAPGLVLQPASGAGEVDRLTRSFHLNLTAFGFLAFATGIFIANSAVGLAVEQRRPLVRTLRALGTPLPVILRCLSAELLLFAIAAAALGLALGLGLAALLLPDVSASLAGLYGADVPGTLSLRPAAVLAAVAMSLAGAGLAGASGLWQIARMPLLASAGGRAWAMRAGRGRAIQAATGAALLALAALLIPATGLPAAFALLAGLLLGAALLLPGLLSLALRAAAALARRPLAEWFWADSRQQLPGLSLALMALLLAMAANVGVSTMVSSFRTTFTGFLDQRLIADLYVDTTSAEEIAALEGAAARLLPLLSADRPLRGHPGELLGMRPDPAYRAAWGFLGAVPDVWDRLDAGAGVIVNEQFARAEGLQTGDVLSLGRELPVLGIYGDYGNPDWQAIVSEELFRQLYPEARPTRFGLIAEDPQALQAALVAGGIPAGRISDQAQVKAYSLSIFERTFTVTAALNAATLGTAALAILFSLLTIAGRRLPQLGPVWALGLTRGQLSALELARALMLAALTGLAAIPLGLALAWALLKRVNTAAFGWELPMALFPADYAQLFGLCLLAAALAALWPAWRLSRTAPAELLKVFAHDR